MEFKTIETQEELDKIIGERIKRAKENAEKDAEEKFSGYLSPDDFENKTKELNEKITRLTNELKDSNASLSEKAKSIAELDAKVKKYETDSVKHRIAHELGIDYELADRIKGENEEEIKKDAEKLVKCIGHKTPPDYKSEGSHNEGSKKNEQFKNMLKDLNLGGE